jgi:archaellum component FlaF (FlaF/FlaG flagellin family)
LDKTITTALLIIAGIVCSVFLFNSVYPMINRSSAAMVSMTEKIDDRMQSQIDIVHAANSADKRTVYIWIKNVGNSRIVAIDQTDVFLGPDGNFMRIPYHKNNDGTEIPPPCWSYLIENNPGNTTEWKPGETVKITVLNSDPLVSGTYFVKVVIPNGIAAEYYFSM